MEIKVNGQPLKVADGTTVAQLVELLSEDNTSGAGMAVAVQGTIVPKSVWSTHELTPQSDVILIKAAYGG
ncbi:MAG: sulfur carrier protein ThiS [Muribaculaceae bacterium]|nr:sulfur carrier protein ThiS [Muribaculaceae bacterium]